MSAPVLVLGAPPRVNLMPRAEIERRERNVLLGRWVRFLLLAILVVAVAFGGAFVLNMGAQQRLAAENARTQALLSQIASMSETRQLIDIESELGSFRVSAMGADVDWRAVTGRVLSVVPEGVLMTGFDLGAGPAPSPDAKELDPDAIGVRGTFTFSSNNPLEIVSLSRSVRALDGVIEADASDLSSSGEGGIRTYKYLVSLSVDQSIYTGRFVAESE